MLDPMFFKPFDGVNVGETEEGTSWRFKRRVELRNEGGGRWILEEDVYGFADLNMHIESGKDVMDSPIS